jgi:hypothetical protein
VLLVFALSGCFAPKPKPDDWRAFGFRGPEATFHSFLTALAGDRPDLEYTCLSADLKRREGGNLLGYLEFRDELRREMPWLKAAARAGIEGVEMLAPDRARILARIDWLFWDETFTVDFVAEDFYEYWSLGQRVEDGFQAFAPRREGARVVAQAPAPEEADLSEITELRLGREWKVDGIALPDTSAP